MGAGVELSWGGKGGTSTSDLWLLCASKSSSRISTSSSAGRIWTSSWLVDLESPLHPQQNNVIKPVVFWRLRSLRSWRLAFWTKSHTSSSDTIATRQQGHSVLFRRSNQSMRHSWWNLWVQVGDVMQWSFSSAKSQDKSRIRSFKTLMFQNGKSGIRIWRTIFHKTNTTDWLFARFQISLTFNIVLFRMYRFG